MEQVVLGNCALAAQRAGGWKPWACAHGIQDAAPAGAEEDQFCFCQLGLREMSLLGIRVYRDTIL